MEKLRNALTRKLGPLPAWAWMTITAGALYFYRQHSGSLSGGNGSDGTDQTAPSYYGPYGQDAYPIQGGAGTGPGNDNGQGTPQPPVINVFPSAPDNKNAKVPRKVKPKPQHKPPKKTAHPAKPHGKTQTAHGAPNNHKPRHPAATHPGSAQRTRKPKATPKQWKRSTSHGDKRVH